MSGQRRAQMSGGMLQNIRVAGENFGHRRSNAATPPAMKLCIVTQVGDNESVEYLRSGETGARLRRLFLSAATIWVVVEAYNDEEEGQGCGVPYMKFDGTPLVVPSFSQSSSPEYTASERYRVTRVSMRHERAALREWIPVTNPVQRIAELDAAGFRFPRRLIEITIGEACGIILSEGESERIQRGDCRLPGVNAFFVDSRVSEEIQTASIAAKSLPRSMVEICHQLKDPPLDLVDDSEDGMHRSLGGDICKL